MTLMLTTEPDHALLLIENFELLSLDQQRERLADAETIRRERDEVELFDLFRMNNDGRDY